MKGIQYSLTFHFREVIELGIDVNLTDLCIFEFLRSFETKSYCQKEKLDDGKIYFWVSHDLIMQQLPLLGIKSKRNIIAHVNKLVESGLLIRYKNTQGVSKSYYRFSSIADKIDNGHPSDEIITPPLTKSSHPSDEIITPPLTKSSHNNIQDIQEQEYNISPNGGLSASALDSKDEKKTVPKTKPKKEQSIVTKGRKIFELYFEKKTSEKYYWKAADGAQMKRLLNQLKFSRTNKGMPVSDEDLLYALQVFLDKITDNWMLSNLSVPNISSKYNELVAQAKRSNGKIGIFLRDNTDEKYLNQKIKQWK
ncbi:hypothetical protein [Hoylesella timonensis]|nr:hypothetical protein [Hoylesella timonensis]